jgi:hypothetical protein
MIDGSQVLLDVTTGASFMLDGVGPRTWTVLTEAASIEEAYRTLLAEYQVDGDRLRDDLAALIASLDAQGLVEIRGV